VIHAVTGDEGIRRWGREALRRSVDSSILRPLVGAVTRVFGLSPASLLKALPQAWRATFRDCGELTIHVGPGGPQIRLVGLAAQLQDRAFQLSISGSLEVIFDLSRTEGRIQLVEPSSGPEARYTVTWQGA